MTKDNHNKIWEAINAIRENHLTHLEADMSSVKTDVSWLKENHKSSKQLIYGILATSIAGLIMGIIKIL